MINYNAEIENTETFDESDFPRIQEELRLYLCKKESGSLSEYILDFCEVYSYRVEEVAEVIQQDKELKSLLRQDCEHHGIFRTDKPKMEEW